MGCLFGQPESIQSIPHPQRWLMFVIAMVETMLWSGTIFGWASLVHIMKVQGVYSDLCVQEQQSTNNSTQPPTNNNFFTASDTTASMTPRGCVAQDERFALLYTVACVVYSTPGVLVGYTLHHLGLAFTRVLGGTMVTSGFLLLSLTSAAHPDYLWGATILLSVGGNTMRMAGLQLANLFPNARNTAMAIISGIYTPSAGVLMLLQTLYESGLEWQWCCWVFCVGAGLVVVLTPLLPRHHIPYTTQEVKEEHVKDPEELEAMKPSEVTHTSQSSINSIHNSLFSVSSLLHAYWLFINLFAVTLFSTHFNSWINRFSANQEEASLYSRYFGWANILCMFFTPVPGLTMDLLARRFSKGKSRVQVEVSGIQAMILPMIVVSVMMLIQTSMLLFRSPWAVYLSLAALIINRPSCHAVGNPFVRARFPADHFNRLIGIQGTALALLTFLQYPHFTWAQTQYYMTFGVTLGAMALSFSQPLHLLSKSYLTHALTPTADVPHL